MMLHCQFSPSPLLVNMLYSGLALVLSTGAIAAPALVIPPERDAVTALCQLVRTENGMVITGRDKVVENFRITTARGTALTIKNADNILINNLHIEHTNGRGIEILNSSNIRITNTVVEHQNAPVSGAHRHSENENIFAYQSDSIRIAHARLYRGSSGVYLIESNDARMDQVYGEDFRGPYPRGQFVQFNRSHNGVLNNFKTVSYPKSWPEDNINIFQSTNVLIRMGLIDGNNAPNGVGVMFDGATSTGRVEDVDTIRMGNGSFSTYDGSNAVTFLRTRSREDICTNQGRGLPASGGTMWTANPRLNDIRVLDSTFYQPCFQLAWPKSSFSELQIKEEDFAVRTFIEPTMCWEAA